MFLLIYLCVWTSAADPGLLGLSEGDEDEGRQGCLGVVTTETTLETQEKRFSLKSPLDSPVHSNVCISVIQFIFIS